MVPVLYIYYFTTAVISTVFSLFIIIAQRVLKINRIFFFLGIYCFMLSLIALTHALLYTEASYNIARELLILERVFGLTAGYAMILLIRSINKHLAGKLRTIIIFSVISVLLITALADLVFRLDLLFMSPPPKINVAPLFRIVYIPFSILGLGGLCYLVFRGYKSIKGKNKKLVGILFYGMISILPFEYWDFMNIMLRKDPFSAPIYLWNLGMFLFFIFIFIFIIQFIRIHIRYRPVWSLMNTRSPAGKSDSKTLKYVYDRINEKMTVEKLFRNPDLCLDDAADEVNASRKELSNAINLHFGDNFNSYLNKYRVEEMKEMLSDPNLNMTILETGIMAGFNSKTSINRFFYRHVKKSPRQFRKEILDGDIGSGNIASAKDQNPFL